MLPATLEAAEFPSLTPAPAASPVNETLLPPTFTAQAVEPKKSVSETVLAPPGIPATCQQPGQLLSGRFFANLTGREQIFRIYLPPCYGQDDRVYPTLYMFHGSVQDDGHWDDLGLDEAADRAILTGRVPPFIIVMPDGGRLANESSGGPNSFEVLVMTELIPYIEANYCAWPERSGRAIGGLSRGGYWALEIAFRNGEHFASVGGHSPALIDSAAGPDINPQYTALSRPLGDLRIFLDIGRADWLMVGARQLHEDLASAAIAHSWTVNDGRHEDAYWAAHVDDYVGWYTEMWPVWRDDYPPCLIWPRP